MIEEFYRADISNLDIVGMRIPTNMVSVIDVSIINAIILIAGFSLAIITFHNQNKWNRASKAMSYSTIHMAHIMKVKTKLDDELKLFQSSDVIPVKKINDLIEFGDIQKTELHLYLNYCENIGIAYYNNVADKDLLFELFAGSIVNTKTKFSEYIAEQRKIRNNNKLWINFEKLSDEWKKQLK